MKTIEETLKKFDEKFGKLNDGCEPGDDCSNGNRAGCDDCEENQRIREEHREFLTQEITELLESLKGGMKHLYPTNDVNGKYKIDGYNQRESELRKDINKILKK